MPSRQEIKEFQSYIWDVCGHVQNVMHMNQFELQSIFSLDENPESRHGDNGDKVLATVNVDNTYLTMTFTWYELAFTFWKDGKTEALVSAIVHEFCHFFTWNSYRTAQKNVDAGTRAILEAEEERTTCYIAKVVSDLMIFGYNKPKFWERKRGKTKTR